MSKKQQQQQKHTKNFKNVYIYQIKIIFSIQVQCS